MDRENKRWFVQRPKCDSERGGFVSVRVEDFYPALVVVTFGIVCGTVLLAVELLYHKVTQSTFWPCSKREFPSVDVTQPSWSV